MSNNLTPDTPTPYQVLDPRLLGRPVHLLPTFAARLSDDLGALLVSPAGRRYWTGFDVERVAFTRAPAAPHLRWLAVREGQGEVAVAFERTLLVGLLEARYGGKGRGQPLRDPGSERVSATEERLAHTLTLQLARTLSARVGAGAVKLSAHAQATASPAGSSWVVEVVLRQAQGGGAARCWLAPAPAMMDTILKMLAPQRERATVRATPAPLASTLKVRLDGRLASKDITLEALFALQVGDVIPVNVGRADVLLDEARLFTAAVAEHKGQLCLTAFEDAE